jgi:hypothetical protein
MQQGRPLRTIVVVDLVDDQRRIGDLLVHPVQVLFGRLGHHNLERVVAACGLRLAVGEAQWYAEVEGVHARPQRRRSL